MHILILDDQLDKAHSMAEDVAYLSVGQIHADVVKTEKDAKRFILKRRDEKLPAYGALLIDERLGEGEEGIAAMKRLLSESPESEAMLFTAHDDAEVGLRALQAGALHYFDRTEYSTEELILRLNEIRALHEFDEVLILANAVRTLDETAQMIVESGRRLGFERARLWRCQPDKAGEVSVFEGWSESGNHGLDTFGTVKMPVEKSWYVPLLLAHPHDIRVFEGEPADGIRSSYLVSQFGSLGYSASLGEWASLRLRWGGATRAVLVLDNATHEGHVIETTKQRLLLRFARSAASALARTAAMDEQNRSQAMAKRVVELVADKDIDVALKEIADQLCKDDPAIANTKLKIVLKNEQALTADYRCISSKCVFERPYRHSLDRGYLVPFLLNEQEYEPLLLRDTELLKEYCRDHAIQHLEKCSYSFVYVPMCVGGKVTGALVLDNDVDETIHYSAEQVNRLDRVAIEISAGIEAGRLREVAERNSIRRKTLIEVRKAIDDSIKSDIDRQQTWHLILTALISGYGIGFNRACLFLVDKSGAFVTETGVGYRTAEETHAAWEQMGRSDSDSHTTSFDLAAYRTARADSEGVTPLETFAKRREKFVDSAVLSEGQHDFTKLSADEAKSRLPRTFVEFIGATPCALVPVRAGEHVLGVVYVDNHAEENYITWESLEEVRALLSYAAQAFQSQREREERIRLVELSNRIFEDGSLKDNLQYICDEALAVTNADLIVIYPMQPGKTPEELLAYGDGRYAVAAGSINSNSVSELPRHTPLGLTSYVLEHRKLIAQDIDQFDVGQFNGLPLSEHSLVRDQNLRALISLSLYDDTQRESFGVLHLGYRRSQHEILLEINKASFLARIVRRAVRSDWWRTQEKSLRGIEADAYMSIMELSLKPHTTIDHIAMLATIKMRDLLGRQRVNQESTVTLLQWKPATETEPAQRFRVDYQIKAPDFQPARLDRLNDPAVQSIRVNTGVIGKALQQEQPVYVREVSAYAAYYQNNSATQCQLARRLTTKDGVTIGALSVESDTVATFDTDLDEVIGVLTRLSGTLVNALENVRQRERSKRVLEAFQMITTPFDLKGTLQKIIEAARDIAVGVSTIAVWYVDSDNPDRLFFENWGCFPELIETYKPEPDGSIRREKAHYISNILGYPKEQFLPDANKQDPPSEYISQYRITSTAHLPLVVREEGKQDDTIGVMFLNFLDRQIFTEEDKTLYKSLASIAAASIRDVNMAQKMGRDAFIASHTAQVQEMAHDLNSQTGLMKSNVIRLKKSLLSDDQMRWLTVIENKLDEMVDGLPALNAKFDRNVYPLALEEIRKMVLDVIESQPKSRGLTTDFDIPAGVMIGANRVLLKRAIDHLLRNSLHPKHHTNHIFVQAVNVTNTPDKIRIIITDDGIGLAPEVETRILRGPLWHVGEDSRLRPSMGLLYARNQVEAMGGTLTYQGKYRGRGAAFALELNLAVETVEEQKSG